MTKINKNITLLFLVILAFSCSKEELPVPKHERGDTITNSVTMGSDYRYQLFFDLETNKTVSKNKKSIWDLGFETSSTGFHVILNTAKAMFVANTQQVDFFAITDTIGLNFTWDETSGNIDSTGIGDWKNTQNVYVLDRGYSSDGTHLGFKKIVFISVNATEYSVKFANLDGTNEITKQIIKDANYNFTFLSLDNGGKIKTIEPPKEDWDFVFTQFTNIFYDQNPPLPYIVTGVIINRNKVEVAKDFTKEYKDVSSSDIPGYTFSTSINTIGYDWKYYAFSESKYITHPYQNYIIKTTEGKYYKLHFIDFYDNLGEKGTPTFEFQEL